jgi:hypothetical protein
MEASAPHLCDKNLAELLTHFDGEPKKLWWLLVRTHLNKVWGKNIFFHSLFLLCGRWEQYDGRDNRTQGISLPRQEREYDNLPLPESGLKPGVSPENYSLQDITSILLS